MSYKDYGKQDWLKVLGITEEKVTYAIYREGIDFIEYNGLVRIRNWAVEDV